MKAWLQKVLHTSSPNDALNLGAALAVLSVPLAGLVGFHLQLKKTPDGRARMACHLGLTLASIAAALAVFHRNMWRTPLWQRATCFALAGALPVVGFRGGRAASLRLFPKASTLAAGGGGGVSKGPMPGNSAPSPGVKLRRAPAGPFPPINGTPVWAMPPGGRGFVAASAVFSAPLLPV
jgi:hypothetical protein